MFAYVGVAPGLAHRQLAGTRMGSNAMCCHTISAPGVLEQIDAARCYWNGSVSAFSEIRTQWGEKTDAIAKLNNSMVAMYVPHRILQLIMTHRWWVLAAGGVVGRQQHKSRFLTVRLLACFPSEKGVQMMRMSCAQLDFGCNAASFNKVQCNGGWMRL